MKYKKLFDVYVDYEYINSEVQLEKGALLLNSDTGEVIAQLRFCNYSSVKLQSLYIAIEKYDDTGALLDEGCRKQFAYLDLDIKKNQTFGDNVAVVLDNSLTRNIKVYLIKYKLAESVINVHDSEIYDYGKDKSRCEVLETEYAELFDKYYDELKTPYTKIFYPLDFGDTWFCSCGKFNHNTDNCVRCGLNKYKQLEVLTSKNALKISDSENLKIENDKKDAETKKKRKIRMGIIVSGIVAFLLVLFLYIIPHIIEPQVLYKRAEKYLNVNKYDEAYNIFQNLGEYKDSSDKAKKSMYCKAEYEEGQNNYQEAYDLFKTLSEQSYENSTYRADEVYKHIYRVETSDINIEVGCCLDATWVYHIGRTLSKNVNAHVSIEYNNDIPDLKNVTVKFSSPSWGGTSTKWTNSNYTYIGEFKDNTLTGEGTLYIKSNSYIENNKVITKNQDILVYKGDFKNGFYDGFGEIYDSSYINTRYLVANFKSGNPVGKYTRYYYDKSINDTGTVDENGIVESSKYETEDAVKRTSLCLEYQY